MQISVQELVELVTEIDSEDSIDWGMLEINELEATELIANSVLDQYQTTWITYPEQDRIKIMLSVIAKLTLENFALNLQRLQ